ncbi:hypothetical protein DB2_46 [Octadecabacter Antarctic DB virus 2]|nr:hypothetical protein DB2_46 [Octadecabacter Antarctic DB virus 2]
MREQIAALMWHTQSVNSGAPASVAWHRTPEAFSSAGKATRDVWLKQADAIIAALPSMVAPLVWRETQVMGCYGLASGLYETYLWHWRYNGGAWKGRDTHDHEPIAAADAHHVAQIMAAFKGAE